MPNIIGNVLDLPSIGAEISARRKTVKVSQAALARQARVSRATLDALENGRVGELGFSKINRLLAALGLELTLQPASSQRQKVTRSERQFGAGASVLHRSYLIALRAPSVTKG